MISVSLHESPDIRAIVRAAFADYRKHSAYVSEFGGGVNINSYWDGGTKHIYILVHVPTLSIKPLPTTTHPFYDVVARGAHNQSTPDVESDHVGNVYLRRLPEGFALVRGGIFCGKPATAHVFLPPARTLPAEAL